MPTTYNKPPYFDDFGIQDPLDNNKTAFDKNYLRILFQPNYAVQVRELNQLQSILQSQIEQFGQSVYKPGTPVIDGITTFNDNISTIDVVITNSNVKDFFDLQEFIEVRGLDSTPDTMSATIIGYEVLPDETHRIWLRYTSGTDLYRVFPDNAALYLQNDIINLPDNTSDTLIGDTQIGIVTSSGIGFSINVGEGVFFTKGCFVHTDAQTKYLSKTNKDEFVSGNIVFRAEEVIVDATDDVTLLDNANGTSNYAAPGANRYTIELTLAFQTDDVEINALNPSGVYTLDAEEEGVHFVNLLKVSHSKVYAAARTEYTQLTRVMAERTFEESGDYTVNPFLVRAREMVNVPGGDGAYTLTQIQDNDLFGFATAANEAGVSLSEYCGDYFIVEIEPSIAYVQGYRVQLQEKKSIPVQKGRASAELEGIYLTLARGNYVDVKYSKATVLGQTFEDLFNSALYGIRIKYMKFLNDDDNFIYYRLFVYNDFNNSLDLSGNSNAGDNFYPGFEYELIPNTAVLDQTLKNPGENKSIFDLPYSSIKGLVTPGGVEYRKQKRYVGQVSTGLTYRFQDSPFAAYERFANIATSDIVLLANGVLLSPIDAVASISPAPDATYVDITFNTAQGINSGDPVEVLIPVTIEDTNGTGLRGNKELVSGFSETIASDINGKIVLTNQDIIISSIIVEDNNSPTNFAVLYDGQGENFYESPVLRAAPSTVYDITYDYFNHTNSASGFSGDYFSADSYSASGVDFKDLPKYKGKRISDYIDFRQKRQSNGTVTHIPAKIVPNSSAEIALDYYLPRYDRVLINGIDGDIKISTGVPNLHPLKPDVPSGTMAIYDILVPGYTFDVKDVNFNYINNRRYTMRNIGSLEKRISNLEYYTTLSILEKETKEAKILDLREGTAGVERFKNGFLVDSFIGHNVGHVKNPDYICAIDKKRGIARPYYKSDNFRLRYIVPGNPTIGQAGGSEVSLWEGANEVFLSNDKAAITMSVQPYEVTFWEGSLRLSPSTDDWMDTVTAPTHTVTIGEQMADVVNFIAQESGVIGTVWDAWQTNWQSSSVIGSSISSSDPHTVFNPDRGFNMQLHNQTTTTQTTTNQTAQGIQTSLQMTPETLDLGTRIIDTSIVPFIRSRNVSFKVEGLQPSTTVYAFFDGLDVTDYCILQETFTEYGLSNDVNTYNGEKPSDWGSGWGTLATNAKGELIGTFRIPNNDDMQFRTGSRIFEITSSPSNNKTERDTYAKGSYLASGLVQTKQTLDTIQFNPEFVKDRVERNRAVVSTSTSTNQWFTDPVAQTFVIGNDHPEGIFLSDIDLFFATKSGGNIDVEVYIVTVENGIPTQTMVPGSKKRVANSDVIVSGRDNPTLPLPATNFKFRHPVYLEAGKEYALVVFSPSPQYRLWVSEFGKFDVVTNTPITKNPSFGVLLKSENASTWTPDQLKDLTIVMNKAVYPTNKIGTFEFTTKFPGGITQAIEDFNFSLFDFMMDTLSFPGTSVVYDLEFLDASGSSLLPPGTYAGVQPKENYYLRKEFDPGAVREVTITAYLKTSNADLTPVIDIERCSLVGIENIINNDSTGEDGTDGGNAIARYITLPIPLNNSADEIRVLAAVNRPSSVSNIEVYAKRKPTADTATPLADIAWEKLPLLSVDGDQNVTELPVDDNDENFYEVEYYLPSTDPNDAQSIFEFSEFTVKVVFLSSDITKVSKIKDFRAIATL